MTVLEITKKLVFKTIFEGEDEVSPEYTFNRDLHLKKHITVDPGQEWGRDAIWQGSISQDKKRKVWFSMPLWSSGIIEADLKKGTWKVHN